MNTKNLNFIFFGTPDVASETLDILKEAGYLPSLVVTSPDRPKGRKMLITPPPVKVWAEENNIPYMQPERLDKKEIWDVLGTLGRSDGDGQRKFSGEFWSGEQNIPDLFLVVAYGKIMPESLLKMPRLGSINIHYSLLPKYRGASPVESAILNGDRETGVTIQQMEFKMDSGPILATEKVPIAPDETAPELRKRLIKIGGELLVKTLPLLANEAIKPIPQNESEATFSKKIKKEDGLIDPGGDEHVQNYNKYRAYLAWPRTYYFNEGKRIIITKAKLEDGRFVIERIIPENGKERATSSNS